MCPTFTVYLFQNQLCFVLGGFPALLLSLLLLSVSDEAKGTLCSLTRRKKVRQDNVPWESEAGEAGCLGVRVGRGCPQGWAGWGAACSGSSDGPACLSLHPETAELLCPALGERRETFPEGLCGLYASFFLRLVDSPVQVRAKLGLAALCVTLLH